jgi:putative peptidoglycan lipid II flippase
VGLLATTLARLFSATYYALRDTRTPLRFATVRLAFGVAIGIPLAFVLPRALGLDPRWGAAGLALASGIAGWVELALLRRALERRIGRTRLATDLLVRLWAAAIAGAAVALGVERLTGDRHPVVVAIVVLGSFGAFYLAATLALGVAEARVFASQLGARLRRN